MSYGFGGPDRITYVVIFGQRIVLDNIRVVAQRYVVSANQASRNNGYVLVYCIGCYFCSLSLYYSVCNMYIRMYLVNVVR